jgi:hypothetical protein
METPNTITKTDLNRIEASLKKLIKATKGSKLEQEYLDLLNHLSDNVNELRLTVEFDHEKRLSAIEEYLQQI